MSPLTNDNVNEIIRYEQGELESHEMVSLFAGLIKSGLAWELQGDYGRTAKGLIDNAVISKEGIIDWERFGDLMARDY